MSVKYWLRPIGIIHTSLSDDEVRNSLTGVPGVIEVFEEFAGGLKGIDGFSHLIVVAYLHKVSDELRNVLEVRPRRLLRLGLSIDEIPTVGVFCTDSPHRPNPIAITIVRLVRREGRFLYVEGLDLFNGTPVIDLRPYTPDRVVSNPTLPQWYVELLNKVRVRSGTNNPPI
jgi:tRNA-Thr(GGU) m(6)t(6)A37 methyltransferase TsaA